VLFYVLAHIKAANRNTSQIYGHCGRKGVWRSFDQNTHYSKPGNFISDSQKTGDKNQKVGNVAKNLRVFSLSIKDVFRFYLVGLKVPGKENESRKDKIDGNRNIDTRI